MNGTLGQDGITIALLSPTLTTNGAQASANAGGLQISISHQLDVPFIPGEPTIPVPELGNIGLPAGLYTVTTSITFGLAQASVSASALTPVSGNSGNSGAARRFAARRQHQLGHALGLRVAVLLHRRHRLHLLLGELGGLDVDRVGAGHGAR